MVVIENIHNLYTFLQSWSSNLTSLRAIKFKILPAAGKGALLRDLINQKDIDKMSKERRSRLQVQKEHTKMKSIHGYESCRQDPKVEVAFSYYKNPDRWKLASSSFHCLRPIYIRHVLAEKVLPENSHPAAA